MADSKLGPKRGDENSSHAQERPSDWVKGKEHWLAAMRWRREVEAALDPLGLTFTRWLVLEATRDCCAEVDDVVSQKDVAARCELDKMTISQVMGTLEKDGLVDRGPSFGTPSYRILVTDKGLAVARRAAQRVAQIPAPSAGPPKAKNAPPTASSASSKAKNAPPTASSASSKAKDASRTASSRPSKARDASRTASSASSKAKDASRSAR